MHKSFGGNIKSEYFCNPKVDEVVVRDEGGVRVFLGEDMTELRIRELKELYNEEFDPGSG